MMSSVKPSSNYQTDYRNFQDGQFPIDPVVDSQASFTAVSPIAPYELPPPYSPPTQYGNLSPVLATTYPPAVPVTYEISCVYCHGRFVLNTATNVLGRCPHCLRFSNVAMYSRNLKYGYLLAAVMLLVMGIFSIIFMQSGLQFNKGLIGIPIVIFIFSAVAFGRFVYICTRTSDGIEGLM